MVPALRFAFGSGGWPHRPFSGGFAPSPLTPRGKNLARSSSPRDYLFEPSVDDVVRYLESVMMEIALSQVILESRLAQYASRFTAMSAAKKRARELQVELAMSFNRARRGEADDRIKEIVNAMNALHVG